jgi:hypothetical protein
MVSAAARNLMAGDRTAAYDEAVDARAYMLAQAPLEPVWSDGASLAPTETFIVDRYRRILLDGAKPTIEAFSLNTLLNDAQRRLLQPYEEQDPASKRVFLPYTFAASAGGHAVYRVAPSNTMRMAFIVVDAMSSRVLSVFETPFGPFRLTTDGKVAIVEEGEVRPEPPPAEATSKHVFKTGRITRFDVASGRQLEQVFDPALSGHTRHYATICVGTADDATVFAADGGLFVIDWQGTPRVRRVGADLPYSDWRPSPVAIGMLVALWTAATASMSSVGTDWLLEEERVERLQHLRDPAGRCRG